MTTMDLFVRKPELRFEVTAITKAASAQLDEDPEVWPRQILTELFRTTPEISDYTPRVSMLKVDEEQGYGLGVVLIENTTNSSLAMTRSSGKSKKAIVPVVIKDHILSPMDVLMLRGGRMLPLNGHTLREALFRPETFEVTTSDWGDTSLWNQFYPPGRSSVDFGSGIGHSMDGSGISYVHGSGMKFSMLESLAPTLLGSDIDALVKAASDPALSLEQGSVFIGALSLLAEVEKTALRDTKDLVKRAALSVPPDVTQIGWSDEHEQYWIKQASRQSLIPARPVYVSRGDILKVAGPEVLKKVDTDGTVTMASASKTLPAQDEESWDVVKKPGIYKVVTVTGKTMVGWVIPNLIDLDGDIVPMAVFSNGAAAMVQDEIAGSHISDGSFVDLPVTSPKGTGVFYCEGPNGVQATVPVLVRGGHEGMSGEHSFLVKSLTGEESRVRVVPGLRKIIAAKSEFHVPDSVRFMPLNDETMTPLKRRETDKTASAKPTIRMFGGDDHGVDLRFWRMPKLASMVGGKRLSNDDAALVLCLAGADPQMAYSKIAQARGHNPVEFYGEDVELASTHIAADHKQAAARSAEIRALRRDLVKEANALPDAMTVDAVLSLGFVNSENIRTFIGNIPYLEKCLSKICELVLGSRLGLTEVPEHAAARAARALDEVIQGLKALALRDVQEGTPTAGG